MADLYSTTAAVGNDGVATVTIGGNARRNVVYYPNATATAASPFTQFGTRKLTILKATAGSGTPFTSATVDDAGSDFYAAVTALQTFGELYHVERISDTVIAFMMSDDTINKWDDTSNTNADYAQIESALGAAVSGSLTFTVAAASLS